MALLDHGELAAGKPDYPGEGALTVSDPEKWHEF
jgi:hypothetical protein